MEYLKRFPTLEGKHILITGSTSGIGLEAAKDFLYLGATVHFMVRNEAKAKDCIASIEAELGHPISTFIHLYDQSDLSSIKACVDGLKGLHLDVIVLNAGVYFPKKGASANGHPLTLQVNAIGTHYCFDCFYALFPDARFVIIDSIAVANPKKNDYMPYFERIDESRWKQYRLSKRITMHIYKLALEQGANVYMAHPGITKTNILQSTAPWFKRASQAVLTWATHPAWKAALCTVEASISQSENGSYFVPRGPWQISGYPRKAKVKLKPKQTKAWAEAYSKLH